MITHFRKLNENHDRRMDWLAKESTTPVPLTPSQAERPSLSRLMPIKTVINYYYNLFSVLGSLTCYLASVVQTTWFSWLVIGNLWLRSSLHGSSLLTSAKCLMNVFAMFRRTEMHRLESTRPEASLEPQPTKDCSSRIMLTKKSKFQT